VKVHRNTLVLSATVFFLLVATFSWLNVFPIYLKQLGATDYQVGVAYSLLFLAFYAVSFLGGVLTDRYGGVKTITLATFAYPALYGLMAIIPDWRGVTFFAFWANIAGSLQGPAFTALMAESSVHRERVFTYLNAFASLGIGVGSLFGAIWVENIGVPGLMGITALVALIVAIVRYRLLVEPSLPTTLSDTATPEHIESSKEVFLLLLRQKSLLLFLVSSVLILWMLSPTSGGPFIALHFQDDLMKTESAINRFFGIGWLAAGIINLVALSHIQKWNARTLLQFSLLIYPLLLVFWAFLGDRPLAMTFFVVSFIFNISIWSEQGVILSDLTQKSHRGRVVGTFLTITGCLSFLGPTVGTVVKMHWGNQAPFLLALSLGVLALITLRPLKMPAR
jgi:MFS family permease